MVKNTNCEQQQNDCLRFKGVRKRKWGKFVSEIRLPNSRARIWLGSYDTAEKAARAFDAALFCLRGHSAKFNFPDNPPDIAGGRSLKPSEIRAVAAKYANSEPAEKSDQSQIMEYSSPSVSEVTTEQLDNSSSNSSDVVLDGSFLDLFTTMDSGNYSSGYGIFPGFDDLCNDIFASPSLPLPTVDYGEEEFFDGVLNHDSFNSFLWNF